MINIRKYFYFVTVLFVSLAFAWYIAVELTKQRIQLEAENRINNFKSKQSSFIWNFNSFGSDVVEPYQKYWQQPDLSGYIKAVKGQNPELSLNFSSEVINTLYHPVLQIKAPEQLHGSVNIQFKTELDDEFYYYSDVIELSGKQQTIDLQRNWQGIADNKPQVNAAWGASARKVSSLVLYFNNPDQDLLIESISLPYGFDNIDTEIHTINCLGEIQSTLSPNMLNINIFNLQDSCLLSSNYLWLKRTMQQRYPQSILTIDQVNTWQKADIHKVNKPYTNILTINSLLYVFMILVVSLVIVFTNKYSVKTVEVETRSNWRISRLLFIGGKKVLSRYKLLVNYAFVLIPSVTIMTYLAFLKFPDLTTFKLFPMYFIWALFQQFFLGYILAEKIFYHRIGNRVLSSGLAALIFSIIHLPSVTLMLATFIAGSFWAYSWLLFKRLIPLALSHALLALMFYYVVSDRILYSAKVLQWFWT